MDPPIVDDVKQASDCVARVKLSTMVELKDLMRKMKVLKVQVHVMQLKLELFKVKMALWERRRNKEQTFMKIHEVESSDKIEDVEHVSMAEEHKIADEQVEEEVTIVPKVVDSAKEHGGNKMMKRVTILAIAMLFPMVATMVGWWHMH